MIKTFCLAASAFLLGTTSVADTKIDAPHLKNVAPLNSTAPKKEAADEKNCRALSDDVTECSRSSVTSKDAEKVFKDCVFKIATESVDRNYRESWEDVARALTPFVSSARCLTCHTNAIVHGVATPGTAEAVRKAMARMKAIVNDMTHREAFESLIASEKDEGMTPSNLESQSVSKFLEYVNEFDKVKAKE